MGADLGDSLLLGQLVRVSPLLHLNLPLKEGGEEPFLEGPRGGGEAPGGHNNPLHPPPSGCVHSTQLQLLACSRHPLLSSAALSSFKRRHKSVALLTSFTSKNAVHIPFTHTNLISDNVVVVSLCGLHHYERDTGLLRFAPGVHSSDIGELS